MNFAYFITRKVARFGQQSFSRLIIRFAVITVALSVTVMIASTALIAGFKKEISSKIFGFWGHIHISDSGVSRSILEAKPISKYQDFYPSMDTIRQVSYFDYEEWRGKEITVEKKSREGIRHVQVFAVKPGIIQANEEIEGIILKGVDQDFDWKFILSYIKEGTVLNLQDSVMSNEILISRQTANRLKVGVGDKFTIHFPEKNEQRKRRFTICGIYKTGLEEYDQKFALVDIRQVQQLSDWKEDEISGFEVFLDDIEDLDVITNYVYYDILPPTLYAEKISEKFSEVFDWLDLQDINEVVIIALMLVVAIINMITALLILILERTNMIGILKALGSTNWTVRKIFLYYAGYIVLAGLFWGNLLGLGLCFLQDTFGFIKLSEENYYLSVAPVDINWLAVLFLNAGTLVVTVLALIIPSYLITRISPVKAIRFK
ncbi:MAG: ABC transporter permease [Saprospiraceae bacterium]|nr:ABC transporter permease [Saprospiraceae bacterium]MCB9322329.1 ABC transporter permease [Lewinellaceae bacterium]